MKPITSAAFDFVLRHDRVLAMVLFLHESVLERKESKFRRQFSLFRRIRPVKNKFLRKPLYWRLDEDVSVELAVELLLCKILDNFSIYLIDLAELVFSNDPLAFQDVLKISVDNVPDGVDEALLHRQAVQAKIGQLSFYGFRRLYEFFGSSFGAKIVESQADYDFLVKMFEIRNCVVHCDGVISQVSGHRCPELAPLVGRRLYVSGDQLTEYRRRLEAIFFDIDGRFVDHFKLPPLLRPWSFSRV